MKSFIFCSHPKLFLKIPDFKIPLYSSNTKVAYPKAEKELQYIMDAFYTPKGSLIQLYLLGKTSRNYSWLGQKELKCIINVSTELRVMKLGNINNSGRKTRLGWR